MAAAKTGRGVRAQAAGVVASLLAAWLLATAGSASAASVCSAQWSTSTSANTGSLSNILLGSKAFADNDVWSVGFYLPSRAVPYHGRLAGPAEWSTAVALLRAAAPMSTDSCSTGGQAAREIGRAHV